MLIVNQYNANERIYYEHYLSQNTELKAQCSVLLYPEQFELPAAEAEILRDLIRNYESGIRNLGFDIKEFGGNTFVVNGVPEGQSLQTSASDWREVIEELIQEFSHLQMCKYENEQINKSQALAISMAKSMAKKFNGYMNEVEMLGMIDRLFACKVPKLTTEGKKTYTIISFDEIEKRFK